MTDAELTLRLRKNLVAFKRLQAKKGSFEHRSWPGVDAFAMAARPRDLNLQQTIYEDAGALAAALPGLEQFYRELGVTAWRVLSPDGDRAGHLLTRAGYRPEGALPAMGLSLDDVPRRPPSLPLRELENLDEVAALNLSIYGAEWADVLNAWHGPLPPGTYALSADGPGGSAAACGVSLDVDDTAGVYLVATRPEERRRGHGTAVLCGLLEAARARGLAASVLQATDEGFGLYRRLGYRDLGVWTHWVRRKAAFEPRHGLRVAPHRAGLGARLRRAGLPRRAPAQLTVGLDVVGPRPGRLARRPPVARVFEPVRRPLVVAVVANVARGRHAARGAAAGLLAHVLAPPIGLPFFLRALLRHVGPRALSSAAFLLCLGGHALASFRLGAPAGAWGQTVLARAGRRPRQRLQSTCPGRARRGANGPGRAGDCGTNGRAAQKRDNA